MRYLLLVLALVICCAAVAPAASAAPRNLPELQTAAPEKSQPTKPGSYDPFVGKGDLHTKAVPVCCCSFGFCEETPNSPCTGGPGPGICRCNQTGNLCVHI
jgi:hypothetical protein